MTLRVCNVVRTSLDETVLGVAGIIPVYIFAYEMSAQNAEIWLGESHLLTSNADDKDA